MKLISSLLLALALSGAAFAGQPMSRADHMKTCAAEWRAKKHAHQTQGLRYQRFLSDCMKANHSLALPQA